jgi:hypothetical protein
LEIFMMFLMKKTVIAASALAFSLTAWAGFSQGMRLDALQTEIKAQVAGKVGLNDMLSAAQAAGIPVAAFASAAYQAGLPVAEITAAVLTQAKDPSVALAILGEVFARNQAAISTVFSTAITMPSITLSAATVESSIEAGCGWDCLSASAVTPLTPKRLTRNNVTPPPAPSAPATSTTSTNNSGGGTGTGKPISPAS